MAFDLHSKPISLLPHQSRPLVIMSQIYNKCVTNKIKVSKKGLEPLVACF